mmetsp:Transcript_20490/g.32099  ORF Transcript_20490/g.32099 Transcript_20490/m.32099 type:complete len:200 (-) Transcript_20490:538-1137(-)
MPTSAVRCPCFFSLASCSCFNFVSAPFALVCSNFRTLFCCRRVFSSDSAFLYFDNSFDERSSFSSMSFLSSTSVERFKERAFSFPDNSSFLLDRELLSDLICFISLSRLSCAFNISLAFAEAAFVESTKFILSDSISSTNFFSFAARSRKSFCRASPSDLEVLTSFKSASIFSLCSAASLSAFFKQVSFSSLIVLNLPS